MNWRQHDSLPGARLQDSFSSSSKTREAVDRLSTLPDNVILHILSFLPMDDVLRTSILSKQWKSLWTSVSVLNFTHTHPTNDEFYLRKFVSFVDKTLLSLHSSSGNIEKFTVNFDYQRRFAPDVNVWIRFATNCSVRELHLMLFSSKRNHPRSGDAFSLPLHLYKNACLEKLSLYMCWISPNAVISWSSLRVLRIGSTLLSDGEVQKIVSGCPVLEFLELDGCWGFDRLELNHTALKKLVINGYCDEEKVYSVVEIWAPSVWVLEILGCWNRKKILLANVLSCVGVKLDFHLTMANNEANEFYRVQNEMLMDMLSSLRHVEDLSLGTWCIEVLSTWEVKCLPSPLSKCKCLTLRTPIQKPYLPGIFSMLQSSPNMETLNIHLVSQYFEFESCFGPNFPNSYNYDGECFWLSKQGLFTSLVLQLKTIKISGFEGRRSGLELLFLQFLLKNSCVLKRMVINAWSVGHENLMPEALHDQIQVAQYLSYFPRCSRDATIIFKH